MAGAKVHITKLAAAGRQLQAAIRMYFSGEDELAIHTVAAASYQLLVDLKAERGVDEVANVYLTSVFYAIRDYRRSSLPEHLSSDPEFMAWVKDLAEQLPIRADSKIEEVTVTVSPEAARQFWKSRNKIANFLKHADRDAGESIALDDVDNLLMLMQCFSAYWASPGSKIVANRRKPGVRREDEKPSTTMINNCRPLLERQIALCDPKVIVLLGGLPLQVFLRMSGAASAKAELASFVGRVVQWGKRKVIPFPHTSGSSFWLNDPANRQLFATAKSLLRREVASLSGA